MGYLRTRGELIFFLREGIDYLLLVLSTGKRAARPASDLADFINAMTPQRVLAANGSSVLHSKGEHDQHRVSLALFYATSMVPGMHASAIKVC